MKTCLSDLKIPSMSNPLIINILLHLLISCVWAHYTSVGIREHQPVEIWFSLSTPWIPGTDLRLVFTHSAILPVTLSNFKYIKQNKRFLVYRDNFDILIAGLLNIHLTKVGRKLASNGIIMFIFYQWTFKNAEKNYIPLLHPAWSSH